LFPNEPAPPGPYVASAATVRRIRIGLGLNYVISLLLVVALFATWGGLLPILRLRAHSIIVVDWGGERRAELSAWSGNPALVMTDPDGTTRLSLTVAGNDALVHLGPRPDNGVVLRSDGETSRIHAAGTGGGIRIEGSAAGTAPAIRCEGRAQPEPVGDDLCRPEQEGASTEPGRPILAPPGP